MVSTERLLEYGKLEPEASLETRPPSVPPASDWPMEGQIEFKNLSYRHSSDGPLVLKRLSCVVKPREKVRRSECVICSGILTAHYNTLTVFDESAALLLHYLLP